MSQLLKVQLEDEDGNIYYLRTSGDSVFLDDGRTVQAAIEQTVRQSAISNVQVNDSSKVPSAALAYAMQQQITENEEAITGLSNELDDMFNPGGAASGDSGKFTQYLSDFLSPDKYGLQFDVRILDNHEENNIYAPPHGDYENGIPWGYYIVFTFGERDQNSIYHRIHQIAFNPFNPNTGRFYMRVQHDENVTDWFSYGDNSDMKDRSNIRLYSNDVTIDVSRASGSASPWTYTATGLSCQTGDQIIVGYLPQSTASADKNAAKAYGYLAKAECTTNGQLKLTFLQAKPATNFKIRVLSFRTVS